MSMTHKYDIGKMLLSMVGYKGLFYPGIFANKKSQINEGGLLDGKYTLPSTASTSGMFTSTGKPLYEMIPGGDMLLAFMPVTIGGILLPYAVMTISGKKTIVETALTGAKGTIKELISVDDYNLSIAGVLCNPDGVYPEQEIREFMELYNKNEAVSLVSAFTDMIFELGNDKVVLKSISFPPINGCEEMQAVKIECVSDAPFELIIE